MAEALSIDVGCFFRESTDVRARPFIFPATAARTFKLANLPKGSALAQSFINAGIKTKSVPYLIEVPGKTTLPGHFFIHKGEEFGYVLNGELQVKIGNTVQNVIAGDVVYLITDTPQQWKNKHREAARLIWLLIK